VGLIRVAEAGEPKVRLAKEFGNGGRNGTITCAPPDLDCLLNRPSLLSYDPTDYLTGWCNTAVACWPKGEGPGAPATT
jgi:hypothetical protein